MIRTDYEFCPNYKEHESCNQYSKHTFSNSAANCFVVQCSECGYTRTYISFEELFKDFPNLDLRTKIWFDSNFGGILIDVKIDGNNNIISLDYNQDYENDTGLFFPVDFDFKGKYSELKEKILKEIDNNRCEKKGYQYDGCHCCSMRAIFDDS